jgi:hypothetical protein
MGLEWGDWDFLPGQELAKRGDFKREKTTRMATPFDVTAKDEASAGKSHQPNQRTNSWRVRSYHMNFQKIATDNA